MSNVHRTSTISSIKPLNSHEHGVELDFIGTSDDSHSIISNTSSSHGKHNSIRDYFRKVVKIFDCLNVEHRGIERVLPEDRNDSTIINTAMMWVRDLLVNLNRTD
jgi:hypothetical protein